MKLLWLTVAPLDSPGYRATQFGMAIALETLGWDVHLMAKTNNNKPFGGFRSFRGNVILIRRKGRLSTEVVYHLVLWKMMLKESYDVVLFEPAQLRLVLLPAILSLLRILKTRFVLDLRTPLVEDAKKNGADRLNYFLSIKFAKWFLPGVTVITDGLKEDLQPILGENKPIAVWGSGVDPDLFDRTKVKPGFRNVLGLEDRFIFLYHGSPNSETRLAGTHLSSKETVEPIPPGCPYSAWRRAICC